MYFIAIKFINLRELLESLIQVINFKKIIKRYKRVVYNMNIMPQSACLDLNPITVDSHGFLFNCKTVGQASDLMMAMT